MARQQQGIKPQDILVLLKLLAHGNRKWRHIDLAQELGLSQTEISFSLERSLSSGFLDSSKKRIIKSALSEFLIHGLKYVFPAEPGPLCRGVPTAHSASPLSEKILSTDQDQYVWPCDNGNIRGQAISPLYKSVPYAVKNDPKLYRLLALVDAMRIGRARERVIAVEEIKKSLNEDK